MSHIQWKPSDNIYQKQKGMQFKIEKRKRNYRYSVSFEMFETVTRLFWLFRVCCKDAVYLYMSWVRRFPKT